MTAPRDIEALRARLENTRGRRVLAQPRSARRDGRIQGVPPPRIPAERLRVARPGGSPRLPEADGCVAGAGRRERLHAAAERGARSVRPPAGGAGSRQTAVLRDGDADERRRHRSARGEATRGGRPRSKAIPIIRRAAAQRTCSRRRRFLTLYDPRSRPRSSRISGRYARSPLLWRPRRRRCRRGSRIRAPASAFFPKRSRRRRWQPSTTSSSSAFRAAKWMQWEPVGHHNAREGSRLAFGEYVDAQYAVDKADRHPVARRRFHVHRAVRIAVCTRVCITPSR